MGLDAVLPEEPGSAGSGADVEAQVIETLDERQCVFLVLIGNGSQDRTVVLKFYTGRNKSLV